MSYVIDRPNGGGSSSGFPELGACPEISPTIFNYCCRQASNRKYVFKHSRNGLATPVFRNFKTYAFTIFEAKSGPSSSQGIQRNSKHNKDFLYTHVDRAINDRNPRTICYSHTAKTG